MLDILEFTMENKKLGGILIGISIVFVIFLIYFSLALAEKSDELNCNVNEECKSISNVNVGMLVKDAPGRALDILFQPSGQRLGGGLLHAHQDLVEVF